MAAQRVESTYSFSFSSERFRGSSAELESGTAHSEQNCGGEKPLDLITVAPQVAQTLIRRKFKDRLHQSMG